MDKDKLEAVQGVVDRVSSYQESAPDGTVAEELRRGLREVDVELDDSDLDALTRAIEDPSRDGDVVAADVVG